MKRLVLACLAVLTAVACQPGAALAFGPPSFGHALAEGTFTESMTTGSDGNVWFTAAKVVGKVTLQGDVTEYPIPGADGPMLSIVTGPDHNLWFVELGAGAIGRSTPDGQLTSFPLPESNSRPTAITAGADGALWFTEGAASRVGRITTSGQITEFPLPPGRQPSAIAAGSDGALWFTEHGANRIGRITTAGQVTEFVVPGPRAKLNAIAAGPDGNLWFTEEAAPKVGRITPAGEVSQFTVPTAGGTSAIISGPGGLLWFASNYEVAAISTAGVVSWPACLVDLCVAPPVALAAAPDGSLWVGSGVEHCAGYCGGGTEISLMYSSGGIGPYVLPPLTLGIGPRISPLRHRQTTVSLACGLAGGCSGSLRLGYVERRRGKRHYRVLAKAPYDLAQNEARRIPLRFSPETLRELRKYHLTLVAIAGSGEQVQAKRAFYFSPSRGSAGT